jgi:hypothetical protein
VQSAGSEPPFRWRIRCLQRQHGRGDDPLQRDRDGRRLAALDDDRAVESAAPRPLGCEYDVMVKLRVPEVILFAIVHESEPPLLIVWQFGEDLLTLRVCGFAPSVRMTKDCVLSDT